MLPEYPCMCGLMHTSLKDSSFTRDRLLIYTLTPSIGKTKDPEPVRTVRAASRAGHQTVKIAYFLICWALPYKQPGSCRTVMRRLVIVIQTLCDTSSFHYRRIARARGKPGCWQTVFTSSSKRSVTPDVSADRRYGVFTLDGTHIEMSDTFIVLRKHRKLSLCAIKTSPAGSVRSRGLRHLFEKKSPHAHQRYCAWHPSSYIDDIARRSNPAKERSCRR
jgi:hypothetical protein